MKIPVLFPLVLILAILCGCGERSADDPRLRLAEKCRQDGDFPAAERQLRRYLQSYPETAEVHLKLASLYDESLNDPLGAAYHYREYLRLNPGSPQSEAVQTWLDAARNRCPAKDSRQNAAEQLKQLEQLARENASLRQLALRLQQELTRTKRQNLPVQEPRPAVRTAPQSAAPPAPVQTTASADPRFHEYEVRRGDTLGRIARHFYGSSYKIDPILKANGLTARSILHIGQKLIIPKQGGEK